MMRAFDRKLVLENGREFYGWGFGAAVEAVGEAVFNTSMAGYQEILSDPAYASQIVVMTYPLIGCYGVNDEDFESRLPAMGGMVVKEYNDEPSNFRYTKTLAEVMEEYGIPGISGVETRTLARLLRDQGEMKAMLTAADTPLEQAVAKLKGTPLPTGLVERVSCKKRWYSRTSRHQYNVVAVDCGIMLGMVRSLNLKGCNVTVVPHTTTPEEVVSLCPDGLFLSGGPGAPQEAAAVIQLVRELWGKLPIFGVGLGCQIIALAYGAQVEKMTHPHRGANLPVRCLQTGKLDITGQNHAYAVTAESLAKTGLTLTHQCVLDGTVEGLAQETDWVQGVQFYPPNLRDGGQESLLDSFIQLMQRRM